MDFKDGDEYVHAMVALRPLWWKEDPTFVLEIGYPILPDSDNTAASSFILENNEGVICVSMRRKIIVGEDH